MLDQRFRQQTQSIRRCFHAFRQGLQERRVQRREPLAHRRRGLQGGPQLLQVARTGRADGQARQHPLKIADFPDRLPPPLPLAAQFIQGLIPEPQDLVGTQRAMNPAPKVPAAHRGGATIDDAGQRVFVPAGK